MTHPSAWSDFATDTDVAVIMHVFFFFLIRSVFL